MYYENETTLEIYLIESICKTTYHVLGYTSTNYPNIFRIGLEFCKDEQELVSSCVSKAQSLVELFPGEVPEELFGEIISD
jgi:hypothetical protein